MIRGILLILTLFIMTMSGCAHTQVDPPRYRVQAAEKYCIAYDCYMKRLGRNKSEVTINEDGHQVIRWYMSVRKIRPLGYGERPTDGMYYNYYDQDCWFTATFDQNGSVLETEWEGPGCWGDGL